MPLPRPSAPPSPATPTPAPTSLAADLRAGFLVFLIALPLCLGIAMASGFPPVAGVLTAIVGGVLVTLLGSARLTIKGPAAGLIVIAVGAVTELGGGDLAVGYRRALAVGVVAAVLQILLGLLRTASVGVAMSPSVVHGMLAAIGVIIIAKQAHVLLGVKPHGTEPLELLAEIPSSVARANPQILLLGLLSLAILFGLPLVRARWVRRVPAPLVVLAVAVPVGLWLHLSAPHDYRMLGGVHHLGPEYLVRLPGSIVDAVAFPDFSVVTSLTSIKYVIMFALIGSIESTLTVLAVDAMDPHKRTSNYDRDLVALGGGNLVSSLIGGLPMISEIVRSRANIDAGATSRWANFFHGALLLAFVALAPGLLQTIPLAALAAMLIYTGSRLASPREFRHVSKVGPDQLALFLTTLVVTLATDLLIGVAAGLALKLVLHLVRGVPVRALLRPRPQAVREENRLRVALPAAATFASLLPVRAAVRSAQGDATGPKIDELVIDVRDAAVVDHTFLSRLSTMAQEWPHTTLTVQGLDTLRPVSDHPEATHRRSRR
ncbi:sulfate transporter [Pilimelia terevasa]|uniref:Sulfate transporter n=1 Tax=Pilimelia terevasa TaxID=53372 RepID=A0A8J3BHE2_9ACTN|nr:SulP family inorganic anion transporter [Pilimelia terevasa]GGK21476.1 sulfate transporter [Pilimelia terevasa]